MQRLDECLDKLRKVCQPVDLDTYRRDSLIRDITERNLEVAIQAILDIGNHIIAASGWQSPDRYADVLDILTEQGVLPEAFALKLRGMAQFRNILVHEYLKIDHRTVYYILQTKVDHFEQFASYIINWLEGERSEPLRDRRTSEQEEQVA